jgi:NAD(P)-dependent dehydrogenase (short-subunit alcohol dehydrogenase family)
MNPAKVIAVTGASRGIGAAIAVELARRGFTVGCLTRNGQLPQVSGANQHAERFLTASCDVNDELSLRDAMAKVAAQAGGLHGLVNNAGIHMDGPSHQIPLADYEKVMATNATAVFSACREAYPHLLKSGGGTIVNLGSFFDKMGVKRNVAYCASKAAVGAITRCLAVEWANRGIRVLDVAPGYIMTDMNRETLAQGALAEHLKKRIPSGSVGSTADVAKLIGAIFSEDIRFLTGETIYIDGAQGIAL